MKVFVHHKKTNDYFSKIWR